MNTKLKNEFNKIIGFDDVEDRSEHNAKIIMFKFLSIIENEMELRNMSKKELAFELNTSPSYVTQLFRGTKTINLIKLAQLQEIFDIEFDIQVTKAKKKRKNSVKFKKQPKSLVTVG